VSTFGTRICLAVSRALVCRRVIGHSGTHRAVNEAVYQEWRHAELHRQFDTYFSANDVAGLDVVDFGCGHGELSIYVATLGARSVIGIEASQTEYDGALNKAATFGGMPVRPAFLLAKDITTIELPDSSVDVLICFDVLEHVLAYRQIIPEWHRILRPGGRVLIWWGPWWNPYGPHVQHLVPIPWCHVFFSERTIIETCARVYDLPEYEPLFWDLDDQGLKKPNRWRDQEDLGCFLNRLTMRQFEAICEKVGLNIDVRNVRGFGFARTLRGWKSSIGKATHVFLYIPFLREFFTLHVTYQLSKRV
jgi:SAM-dependent methyltransferase